MLLRSLVAVLLGLTLALSAAGTRADEPKLEGDLKAIQGEWVSKDEQGESLWTFKVNHLSIKTPDRAYEIKIALDPKAEPEKHIEFDVAADSPNAKAYKAKGIYKVASEGEVKVAFAGEDLRPTEFKTDFAKQQFAFELKRKK